MILTGMITLRMPFGRMQQSSQSSQYTLILSSKIDKFWFLNKFRVYKKSDVLVTELEDAYNLRINF